MPQRGYLWQREWTPAVADAIGEADRRMNGIVLLGGEINVAGPKPEIVKAAIDWDAVRRQTKHCSIALRVAPFSGTFADDKSSRTIVDAVKDLINQARVHGVDLEEFQLDFDCAQKNLGGYRAWLQMLKPVVHPTRFVITTLPAWLDNREFPSLLLEADGFVLQVHSVPIANRAEASLCDTRLARQWVKKAARLHRPFSVALPTYRCSAGYGPDGKLLSVAMDSVQPAWPPKTRVLEFGTEPDQIAGLVNDWQRSRPQELRELLWYRVPVATDTRNWRWTTLSAVMSGRPPEHQLDVVQDGVNPIDLSIVNAGEADEQVNADVRAIWQNAELTASDALTGWNIEAQNHFAIFHPTSSRGVRLAPGARRKIGWLRFDQPATLRVEFSN